MWPSQSTLNLGFESGEPARDGSFEGLPAERERVAPGTGSRRK
jgi:hypothetical protein